VEISEPTCVSASSGSPTFNRLAASLKPLTNWS